MKSRYLLGAISLIFVTLSAGAAEPEFNQECALGLAHKQHVATDCSVSWVSKNGSVYCFSNAEAKSEFLKDVDNNVQKAEVFWSSERIGQ